MYLDWKEREAYVIDVEADSLEPTVIHVMCWLNVHTGEKGECYSTEEIQSFFSSHPDAAFIGHNILAFDAPVLNRLAKARIKPSSCIDTLILSQLYSPSLAGGHSLGAWGDRLNRPKIEFDNFEKLTPEMVEYCHQDAAICGVLFIKLMKTLTKIGFTEKSIDIQHKFMVILNRQKRNGFKFNIEEAVAFYSELRQIERNLEDEVRRVFPAERVKVADRAMFTKSGRYTAIYLKDRERYHIEQDDESGSYTAYEDVEFNLGSPIQRVQKLKSLGWVPGPNDPVTKTGNPKPFEKGKLAPSLEALLEEQDVPEIRLIAKWMTINGRANMVNTWLDNYNEEDGCIHGKLFVADTLRLRHQAPNTANIPGVRVKEHKDDTGKVVRKEVLYGDKGDYTYEARNLWVAREGRVLVGTDAAGLELRMLAHYLNRASFTEQVLGGDPHQYNADTVGIPRPLAKTLLYAIQYGAQAPRVAATIGVSVAEGAKIRNQFLQRLGLEGVMQDAQDEQAVGRVRLIDGSQVVCPSPHSALNYRLQGGGARVMALGCIFLEQEIHRKGLDSLKVGDIHDEWQYDVHPDDAEEHGRLAVQAIRDAGEELRMNIPLDGESKIGRTWAETH